jgi:hypothetical protein
MSAYNAGIREMSGSYRTAAKFILIPPRGGKGDRSLLADELGEGEQWHLLIFFKAKDSLAQISLGTWSTVPSAAEHTGMFVLSPTAQIKA